MNQDLYDIAQKIAEEKAPEAFSDLEETDATIGNLENQLNLEYRAYHRKAEHLLKMLEIEKGMRYTDKTGKLNEITNIQHNKDTTKIVVNRVKEDGSLYQQSMYESKFDMMTFIALTKSFKIQT